MKQRTSSVVPPAGGAVQHSYRQCIGIEFVAPGNQSATMAYPFSLHEVLILPWDYERRNGTLWLRSHGCSGRAGINGPCASCEGLPGDRKLDGILQRAENGVHENARLHYHGFGSLMQIHHRKTDAIDRLRLQRLNEARHIVRIEGALASHKQLVLAISSRQVKRVDAVLRSALGRDASVHTMLRMLNDAANDIFHPRSHSEREAVQGALIYRTCGARGADLAHRMFGTLAKETIRNRQLLITLEPSPAAPTTAEIARNTDACFESIAKLLAGLLAVTIIHAVLMFDEIALEKCFRYDEKTNMFLGICREHVEPGGRVFTNEDDLELLFDDVVEDKVHFATEVRVLRLASC